MVTETCTRPCLSNGGRSCAGGPCLSVGGREDRITRYRCDHLTQRWRDGDLGQVAWPVKQVEGPQPDDQTCHSTRQYEGGAAGAQGAKWGFHFVDAGEQTRSLGTRLASL